MSPSEQDLDLAETLVNHQWGVSVHKLGVAFAKVRNQGKRDGIEQCIAELTRHARLDSTGDETKAAMHIVVNWLHRTLTSPSPDTRHSYTPNRKYPWFCAECGYPEHERLQHAAREQEATDAET